MKVKLDFWTVLRLILAIGPMILKFFEENDDPDPEKP